MRKEQMEKGKGTHIIAAIIAIASVLSGVAYMMTRPKPQFETTGLEINKPSETASENTEIFFTLSNNGNRSGTFNAELQVDGKNLKNQSVKLAEKENTIIGFSVKIKKPGEHSVKIGKLSENFRIKPPDFKVNGLTITPKEAIPGKTLRINVEVKNTGDLPGDYTAKLKVDGSIEARKPVTLSAGENKTLTFEIKKETKKSYTVNVGGLSGSFEVLAPAEFKVTDLSVSPSRVNPGETVNATVNIKNVGDLPGNHELKLRVNGTVEDNKSVHLEGHENTSLTFLLSKQREGNYRVKVGNSLSTFEVYTPPSTGGCPVCG